VTRNSDQPCQGQALLYYGDAHERFCEVFTGVGVATRVVVLSAAQVQLAIKRREAPPRLRDQVGGLQQAVFQTVQSLQPCTNAQVKAALGERREVTHRALQVLVTNGKLVKDGQTYRVVDIEN
jgi:hypothetical protein